MFEDFTTTSIETSGARLCLDHPDRVINAALPDILPSQHVWTHIDKRWATEAWHWVFMTQPHPFPEQLMAGVPAD